MISLNDFTAKETLKPLTSLKAVADIRIGIFTIREKWELLLAHKVEVNGKADVKIPAAYIPTKENYRGILDNDSGLMNEVKELKYPWQVFQWNEEAIRNDFDLLTYGRRSREVPPSNTCFNEKNIFIEEGAKIYCSNINAEDGPVYIGKNALIMEGSSLRGPVAICENSVVKMGSRIYGGTTVGPYCTAGGEIKNSILSAFSNKAHDGYLGDSVIGEWCNLGAGTTNSNVKNNAGTVYFDSGENRTSPGIKGGLIMGDYSRSAINTSFNTGTVVGISCNVFSPGFPPKNIPDFSWGGQKYIFEKAIEDINNWKKLKNSVLSEEEYNSLKLLYQSTNHA